MSTVTYHVSLHMNFSAYENLLFSFLYYFSNSPQKTSLQQERLMDGREGWMDDDMMTH